MKLKELLDALDTNANCRIKVMFEDDLKRITMFYFKNAKVIELRELYDYILEKNVIKFGHAKQPDFDVDEENRIIKIDYDITLEF